MSMTRAEAIERLEKLIALYEMASTENKMIDYSGIIDTLKFSLSALRPVSREQVEKAWMGCKYCDEEWGTCNPITNRFTMPPRGGIRFCPMCGRPLTDEAVQMVMERLEALYEQTKAD